MNLANIGEPNSERIERKVILSLGQSHLIRPKIFNIGFKQIHERRKITSIYFDDLYLNALRDNIDGNRERNKIRLRYYNDIISSAFLEIKQKRGILGYKEKISLSSIGVSPLDLDQILEEVSKWLKTELATEFNPVSKINYSREYFQKRNCRLTIDTKLTSNRLSSSAKNLSFSPTNYEVIEFKYKKEYDEEFRSLFERFNSFLRATKSSK
ncbi:MAG: VTC domain-containing protein, partial [Gammaproteobacteria bacterium]